MSPGPLVRKSLIMTMLGARTHKLRRDVGPHQQMTPRTRVMVKVTITFSTKTLIIRQCYSLEPLNGWDVGPDQ